jgi:membrane fusion protein
MARSPPEGGNINEAGLFVTEHSPSLFREEASRHHANRLHGNVTIATPLAWQVIGVLLLVALVATLVFLSVASYARVEVVSGKIALDKGVAIILPTRAGVVESVMVAEGEKVRAGERLALVRAGESLTDGRSAPERIRDALARQDTQLADQTKLNLEASTADQQRWTAQIEGDRAIIASLGAQIAGQQDLIAAAEADYNNATQVASRGYISKRELEQRRVTMVTRRQQLAQLQQAVSDKQAAIAQARRAIAQAGISARAQAAGTQSSRASLSQQRVEADLAQGYALKSPTDGIVTALTARPGQPVTPEQQLMMVIPPGAQPTAELYIPTTAAGFIAPGQEVRLSIGAYNYQTFGTVEARILTVSRAAVTQQGETRPVPVYLVTAAIGKPWIVAFGQKQPLLPGMTLSARIITEKRSLIKWLFEPLFAVGRR